MKPIIYFLAIALVLLQFSYLYNSEKTTRRIANIQPTTEAYYTTGRIISNNGQMKPTIEDEEEINWTPGYISRYDISYNIPLGYIYSRCAENRGGHYFKYSDGIEIRIYGFWGNKNDLKDFYLSDIANCPIYKVFKKNWYVVSDTNGDGTEYYTRSGIITSYSSEMGETATTVIATMTITYPVSAKRHAQQIIQKYFKGFPKAHQ